VACLDSSASLDSALRRDAGGIAVVYYATLEGLAWNKADVRGLAPAGADPVEVADYESALAHPHRVVLLVPADEVGTVLDMDGGRDRVFSPDRTQPIVLFLLRGGDGDRALHAEATSLRSFVQGSEVDPDREDAVDLDAERRNFAQEAGLTPDAWLAAWAAGTLPATAENYRRAFSARWLVEP
jgi:hypothetical protein